jgi:hypothetical protein
MHGAAATHLFNGSLKEHDSLDGRPHDARGEAGVERAQVVDVHEEARKKTVLDVLYLADIFFPLGALRKAVEGKVRGASDAENDGFGKRGVHAVERTSLSKKALICLTVSAELEEAINTTTRKFLLYLVTRNGKVRVIIYISTRMLIGAKSPTHTLSITYSHHAPLQDVT